MKLEPVAAAGARRHEWWVTAFVIVAVCFATFLFFARRPLIPDIAWLIEASRRWMAGAKLYVDIIEVNPPLIFYDTVLLTGGLLTPGAYVAGVCIVMALSALWAARLRGSFVGIASLGAMILGGITDFGQRDHLGLIFVIPFLLGNGAPRKERALLGAWAFLGVGLKPYLIVIPVAAAATRALLDRSPRPLFSAEMQVLALACAAYSFAIAIVHPDYLNSIVPLGRFVYWAYGIPLNPLFVGLSIALVITASLPLILREAEKIPLSAAIIAALASFYIQGRYFSYHFVPAIGLGILLALWMRQQAAMVLASVLSAVQLYRGPPPEMPTPIPAGAKSVAVLVQHVVGAYPAALYCGVRNTTRYPALWVIPGAWNILNDRSRSAKDRLRAAAILNRERAIIRGDIVRERPQFVFVDKRKSKPYFQFPFDYDRFLGPLPSYHYVGKRLFYDVWSLDGAPSALPCNQHF